MAKAEEFAAALHGHDSQSAVIDQLDPFVEALKQRILQLANTGATLSQPELDELQSYANAIGIDSSTLLAAANKTALDLAAQQAAVQAAQPAVFTGDQTPVTIKFKEEEAATTRSAVAEAVIEAINAPAQAQGKQEDISTAPEANAEAAAPRKGTGWISQKSGVREL